MCDQTKSIAAIWLQTGDFDVACCHWHLVVLPFRPFTRGLHEAVLQRCFDRRVASHAGRWQSKACDIAAFGMLSRGAGSQDVGRERRLRNIGCESRAECG